MSEILRTRGSRVLILIAYLDFGHFPTLRFAFILFLLLTPPQYPLPYDCYLDPASQEEFGRNIESLAKWIEGAIQRFRAGGKNSRIIELHDTNHYVFIVDERFTRRGGRWSFEKCASSHLKNEGSRKISVQAARQFNVRRDR